MSWFRSAGLKLGEPTPEDQRPRGWLAWLLGIAAWVVLMGVVGLLFWLLY